MMGDERIATDSSAYQEYMLKSRDMSGSQFPDFLKKEFSFNNILRRCKRRLTIEA
jgi:hypothetical protein